MSILERTPTLAQVAALAGVSPATVSRALTGSAPVSPDTRALIDHAVQRLGYVRHRSTPADGSIAVVICEDSARFFADPFYSRILWGINRELRGGPPVVVLQADKPGERQAVGDYLRGGGASGILLVSPYRDDAEELSAAGVPLVRTGRPEPGSPFASVEVDDRYGAEHAVEHLVRTGHRVIATVAGPSGSVPGGDRLAGYRTAMAAAGLGTTGLVCHGDFCQASGEHAMNWLLGHRPELDAVLVASDLMAVGALRALRRAGRRVPGDVAVIGFDDAPLARKLRPALTTVYRPVEKMGGRMARQLVARMAGRNGTERRVVLRTKLILRDTA